VSLAFSRCEHETAHLTCPRVSQFGEPIRVSTRLVHVEPVALIPQCVECEARWLPADGERWSAYLTDDEPPELAFYCPDCRDREFGGV
jgi:hypothetical protein